MNSLVLRKILRFLGASWRVRPPSPPRPKVKDRGVHANERFQRSEQDPQGDEGEKRGHAELKQRQKGDEPQTGGGDRAQRSSKVGRKDSEEALMMPLATTPAAQAASLSVRGG